MYQILVQRGVSVHRVARLVFCRPNVRNLASFQVGWPKNFSWPFGLFWLHLKLAGLVFGLLALFWPFYAEIEGKYCYSIFSETHLQNFCNKCYIRRLHSDISNIWAMIDSKLSSCVIIGSACTHCTL